MDRDTADKLAKNAAYGMGYVGMESPYADSKIGVGPALHAAWLKGKDDKSNGVAFALPHPDVAPTITSVSPVGSLESQTVSLPPVSSTGARRGKKTKKGGRKGRKGYTRRR